MSKRSVVEVSLDTQATTAAANPFYTFASMLKEQYGGDDVTTTANIEFLEFFIGHNYISKSSIIWHNGHIKKIYGIRLDNNGRIRYNKEVKKSPEKKKNNYVTANPNKIDMSAIRSAVARVKQTTSF